MDVEPTLTVLHAWRVSCRGVQAAIVRAAYNKSSEDNITAVVVEFPWARSPLPEDDEDGTGVNYCGVRGVTQNEKY